MPSREKTINDYKERLNKVLLYIQENIEHPLSLEILSDIACLSPFRFHRLFAAYVGETLNDYIRRIRLEYAALRLCHSEEPITSIALAAGYETPAAFTKAFRFHFGKNPTEFKRDKKLSSAVKLIDLNTKGMSLQALSRGKGDENYGTGNPKLSREESPLCQKDRKI